MAFCTAFSVARVVGAQVQGLDLMLDPLFREFSFCIVFQRVARRVFVEVPG